MGGLGRVQNPEPFSGEGGLGGELVGVEGVKALPVHGGAEVGE
jgi:hypothetical protein